jgi:hypothetical protein
MKDNMICCSKKINWNHIIVNGKLPSPCYIQFSHTSFPVHFKVLNWKGWLKFQEMWWFWKTKTSYLERWWWRWWWRRTKRQWRSVPSVHQHTHAHAYAPNTRGGKGRKKGCTHCAPAHTHAHTYAPNRRVWKGKLWKSFFFGRMIEPRFARRL